MGNLTEGQVQSIAETLRTASEALSAYIITNQTSLDAAIRQQLFDQSGQLLDSSDQALQLADQLLLQDVELQMAQINAINAYIGDKLTTLGDIQKVINVAADLVTLATAICTFQPGQVASCASDILGELGVNLF